MGWRGHGRSTGALSRLLPRTLLINLAVVTAQCYVIPTCCYFPPRVDGRHFIPALMCCGMISYWLLAGLAAIHRPYPDRLAFRTWLSDRTRAARWALVPGLLVAIGLVLAGKDCVGVPIVVLSWCAAALFVMCEPIPPCPPGGADRRPTLIYLRVLRTFFVLLVVLGTLATMIVAMIPVIEER